MQPPLVSPQPDSDQSAPCSELPIETVCLIDASVPRRKLLVFDVL